MSETKLEITYKFPSDLLPFLIILIEEDSLIHTDFFLLSNACFDQINDSNTFAKPR